MKEKKFLSYLKFLFVTSLIAFAISLVIEQNHVCTGEDCEICYIFSLISLVSFTTLFFASISLLIYVFKIIIPYYLHQDKEVVIHKPLTFTNSYSNKDVSLVTLEIKLQIAM